MRPASTRFTSPPVPLNVVETLNNDDSPDEDTPQPDPYEDKNDDGSGSDASENTGSGGKKGGALDFLSLLFLTGSSILLRGRRKK